MWRMTRCLMIYMFVEESIEEVVAITSVEVES